MSHDGVDALSYNDLQASLGLVLKIGGVDRKLNPNYSITPSIYCNSRIWPAGGKACPYVSGVEARITIQIFGFPLADDRELCAVHFAGRWTGALIRRRSAAADEVGHQCGDGDADGL